ncbi:thioredoxin family protein, partial [Sulfurovum sp. bin170]|uniref:thioredoxin family protein n=1 Tax=Sulfurovum sp. bin170 TaxID=2695268 RepID=UPI0013E02498
YQNDYKIAEKEAKVDGKYLFILITTKGCGWCKRLKRTTLNEREIKENLAKKYIAVELDRDSSYYPSSMNIQGVPSVFIIDPKSGETIRDIVGFRKDKNDYLKWFRYVTNLEE